ncbi:MAG TPA: hypothetical protein VM101_00465 [Flavitalea sp.]|nr:hypothetical protein [Flavitalea sp.]
MVTFIFLSLLLFSWSAGRIFLSDDYCTLHNIVANNSILMPSFFRPVGDLTLKWTYQLAGWEPFYFYLVNILLHAVNSFLVYVLCIKLCGQENRAGLTSIIAGLIFLTYPSHSEAIFWAIGRGISLAVFFCLLTLIFFISRITVGGKYILVSLFYSLALASYESSLLLPFVLFTLAGGNSRKHNIIWSLVLMATLFFHLYLRYHFTGGIWQAYNQVIFANDIIQYLSSFIKIILRLFIPPVNHPLLFSICGTGAFVVMGFILYRNRKEIESDNALPRIILFTIMGLAASILVSISFGMSTRTSEGDRLMYLPSVFYSIMIAILMVRLVRLARTIIILCALLLMFQVGFLLMIQNNWIQASEHARKVIGSIGAHKERPLYIINVPSDENGAFVFRNCLPQALLHYNIDTTGVKILNVIQSAEIEKKKDLIVPEKQGKNVFIWPITLIEMNGDKVNSVNGYTIKMNTPLKSFLYWNKEDLVEVQ